MGAKIGTAMPLKNFHTIKETLCKFYIVLFGERSIMDRSEGEIKVLLKPYLILKEIDVGLNLERLKKLTGLELKK